MIVTKSFFGQANVLHIYVSFWMSGAETVQVTV